MSDPHVGNNSPVKQSMLPVLIDGKYWITVTTDSTGFLNSEELELIKQDAQYKAVVYLVEYFDLVFTDQQVSEFIDNAYVMFDSWFLDARPNSAVMALVAVVESEFHKTFGEPNIALPIDEMRKLANLEIR